MSTRRSPRLKGLSPKPELPPKPRPPKRVKDVLGNSVREANFQVELAAWEAAKEEHDNLMKKRKTKQKAAGRAAGKSAAEAEAPPPAAPLAPTRGRRRALLLVYCARGTHHLPRCAHFHWSVIYALGKTTQQTTDRTVPQVTDTRINS